MPANLKVVKSTHRPVVVDLYGPWRAEIEERDWERIHCVGDRREPLELDDRPRRIWR